MKEIDISYGEYASQWGLTDFYQESYDKLVSAIASGEDFTTGWFGCKKEIRYGKYTKEDGEFRIEVDCCMDDLWESDELIYDALWSACKMEIELPDEVIDSIREGAEFIDDHTKIESVLPYDATIEDVIAETDRLEGSCEMANEAMFDELCEMVKAHVEYFNLKGDKENERM